MNCVRAGCCDRAAGRIDRSGRITENDDTGAASRAAFTIDGLATAAAASIRRAGRLSSRRGTCATCATTGTTSTDGSRQDRAAATAAVGDRRPTD